MEFLSVVDLLFEPAHELAHIDILVAHAEITLEEIFLNDRPGDSHGHRTEGQVALPPHGRNGQTGPCKAKDLLPDVFGNGCVPRILNIPSVDTKGGQSLLVMGREHRSQIDRTGPLRAIEPPHRLGHQRIHIHGFRAVAPTGSDGQGYPHSFPGELLMRHGRFRHPADAGIGDHAFHRKAVGLAQILRDDPGRSLGHLHGLVFQAFPHTSEPAVDGRADTDFRHASLQSVPGWIHL